MTSDNERLCTVISLSMLLVGFESVTSRSDGCLYDLRFNVKNLCHVIAVSGSMGSDACL